MKRIMNRKNIVIVILCIFLVTSLVLWQVDKINLNYQIISKESEISEKDKIINSLKNDLEKLQSSYSDLKVSYIKLSSDYELLNLSYQNLQSQYSMLEEKFEDYKETHAYSNTEYLELNSKVSNLELNLSNLTNKYNTLKSEYSKLYFNYSQLYSEYNTLSSNYSKLYSEYSKLYSEYSALKASLKSKDTNLNFYYAQLSQNVLNLYNLLQSYVSLPQSFSRVLNKEAVNVVSSIVYSITEGLTSRWSAYQKIYDYITSNIKYVNDIDMLYINNYWYVDVSGFEYITKFEVNTTKSYIQTPKLTLETKQGDCEDQAILAYAMIQYYRKYIMGTEYSLYIAHIEFSDGIGHAAVFLPVKGGEICIIDPAGKYLTSSNGEIASKPASTELQEYSNYWSEHGTIKYIKLYSISITDGSYKIVAEGNINKIVEFLSQS